MFKKDLKDRYEFLTRYFEQGMKNPLRSISHSILFYGQDIQAQYELAIEISRLLNCHESQDSNCSCLNCNWVRANEHPAVMTISKIDNKPSDDDSKTVISVKQSQMVKNLLLNTSDYHRVFIFCDAQMCAEKWIPMGLNKINFQEETANSLLKIIEEPPENTTFFFLARDKHDLLETIISRSQSFFVPSYDIASEDFTIIKDILEDYFTIERKKSLDFAQSLFIAAKEHSAEKVLTQMQSYFTSIIKSNIENTALTYRLLEDIKTVETAKIQIQGNTNLQMAIDNMCLNLIK